jgi:hypothetical protein
LWFCTSSRYQPAPGNGAGMMPDASSSLVRKSTPTDREAVGVVARDPCQGAALDLVDPDARKVRLVAGVLLDQHLTSAAVTRATTAPTGSTRRFSSIGPSWSSICRKHRPILRARIGARLKIGVERAAIADFADAAASLRSPQAPIVLEARCLVEPARG